MEDGDYLSLSAQEFGQLEEWQLQEALQQLTGHMAVAEAERRNYSEDYHRYLTAKDRFAYLKSIASTLQTLLRSKV